MEGKKKKGLFDVFWMAIKLCVFIIFLPALVLLVCLAGGIFLPAILIMFPIIFIACILVLLE